MNEEDLKVYEEMPMNDAKVVAQRLEALALRIREQAKRFPNRNLRNGASGVAADIVNDFTQGVGNIGAHLWGVVHNAAAADRVRHESS